MKKTIGRPRIITQFLSHMFSTPRDRLYFEMVINSIISLDGVGFEVLELVMPTNVYFKKYNTLRKYIISNDSQTPDEIYSNIFMHQHTIIVDMCNTTKTAEQQVDFTNELCNKMRKNRETYSYIFLVKDSLCKDDDSVETFTLNNYNDNYYEFTLNEIQQYRIYSQTLGSVIQEIYGKIYSSDVNDLIDYYIKNYQPVVKRPTKKEQKQTLDRLYKQLNATDNEMRMRITEDYYDLIEDDDNLI